MHEARMKMNKMIEVVDFFFCWEAFNRKNCDPEDGEIPVLFAISWSDVHFLWLMNKSKSIWLQCHYSSNGKWHDPIEIIQSLLCLAGAKIHNFLKSYIFPH